MTLHGKTPAVRNPMAACPWMPVRFTHVLNLERLVLEQLHRRVVEDRPYWFKGVPHRVVSITSRGVFVVSGDTRVELELEPIYFEAIEGMQ